MRQSNLQLVEEIVNFEIEKFDSRYWPYWPDSRAGNSSLRFERIRK